jgi:hypothetical protein
MCFANDFVRVLISELEDPTLHRIKKEKRSIELAQSHRLLKLRKEEVYVNRMEQGC